jgi:prepilin-type N-terminal cleavage/methylation domain-containing protein
MSRRRAGFTLAEVLITMTLIGLLAAISVGRFSTVIAEGKVSRGAQSVGSAMQSAFDISARNRAPVRVNWSSDSVMLTVTNVTRTKIYRRVALGTIGEGIGLRSSQVTFTPTAGIVVYPQGFATDSISVTFLLKGSGSYGKRIRMTRAGLVQTITL